MVELAAFDREELWKEYGYTSLYDFLTRELHASNGTAYLRQTAARLVEKSPEVLDALRDGRLCISVVGQLAQVLTDENRGEVLPRFFHASARRAKELRAEIRPAENPPSRTVVTPLPQAPATTDRSAATETWHAGPRTFGNPEPARELPVPPPPRRTETEPLNRDQARLHVTVGRALLPELEELKALLSHRMPGASTERLLALAVHELLVEERRKKALVEKPRPAPPPRPAPEPGCQDARHIPAAVEREVRIRDQGKCRFRLENGEICGSTRQVELHHLKPHADGGTAAADDLSLRCHGHHRVETERQFGDGLVAHCQERRRARRGTRGGAEQPGLL